MITGTGNYLVWKLPSQRDLLLRRALSSNVVSGPESELQAAYERSGEAQGTSCRETYGYLARPASKVSLLLPPGSNAVLTAIQSTASTMGAVVLARRAYPFAGARGGRDVLEYQRLR